MHGQCLLERGILWRVEDGEDIIITKDKWIPESPYHPIKPIVDILDELRVSALIDGDARKWNEELVRIFFDTESVINIPVSQRQVHDCISWPFTKTSVYSVKSAYFMAKSATIHLKVSSQGKGASSDQVCTAKEWKTLWNIKAPPKMKIVLLAFCA